MLSNQGFQISLHTFKTTSSSQKLSKHSIRINTEEKRLNSVFLLISVYCNKNQPNDYIFDYIFCEIN